MKRELLYCLVMELVIGVNCWAWCDHPDPVVDIDNACYDATADRWYAPVNEVLTIDASDSFDRRCSSWGCTECGTEQCANDPDLINGLRLFQWSFGDGSAACQEDCAEQTCENDSEFDGSTTHTYTSAGCPGLSVTLYDRDGECCCSEQGPPNCSNHSSDWDPDLAIVEADLTITGLDEEDEEDPGTVACLGGLTPMSLSVAPTGIDEEVVVLTFYPTYQSKIKVWLEETKETEVTHLTQWAPSDVPATLYVEGVSASSSAGDVAVTLNYTCGEGGYTIHEDVIYFTVISVEITDDGGTPITSTQTVSVGNKISLKTQLSPSLSGVSWEWTVPGTVVKDYTKETIAEGRTKAYVTELDAADKEESTIAFYWVDGADGREVSVDCSYSSGSCRDTVTFNVKRPTLDSFTSTTGDVVVGSSFGEPALSFGTSTSPGIEWSAEVTASDEFEGELKFTQILNSYAVRTKTDDSEETLSVPAWWLDFQDPYESGGVYGILNGTTRTIGYDDSPAVPLEVGYKKMYVYLDKFEVYTMFRPISTDRIWVPLGKLEWGWAGVAESTDGGNTWSLTTGAPDASDPSGSTTTEFPEWPDTATDSHPTWE